MEGKQKVITRVSRRYKCSILLKFQQTFRFPYKFSLQIIKITLVTMQLILFAHARYNHVSYTWDNKITFSHLFLKGWDATMEVLTYPPSAGPLSVYSKQNFYDAIDFAIAGYRNLGGAIGPYSYSTTNNSIGEIQFCVCEFQQGAIYGFNESYNFDPRIVTKCAVIPNDEYQKGIQDYLRESQMVIHFPGLVKATVEFAVKTVNLKSVGPFKPPDCYKFDIKIVFDNSNHDGQMLLTLQVEPMKLLCHGSTEFSFDDFLDRVLRSFFNLLVITTCCFSFILCIRSLLRAQSLKAETDEFFLDNFGRPLSLEGKFEFINLWYVMIVINDLMLITGSIIKEQIDKKRFSMDDLRNCSLFLGVGNLLVWFGILRYLGFFKTYNAVILTFKKAAPKMTRFMICALIIFFGFAFCGWLVMGPYHIKFRTFASTCECLYSLVNGDDMFATFYSMGNSSPVLWYFCRIYLYSFISLFIYVILSLFVTVIVDSYDTIKEYYKEGFPETDLQQFINGTLTM